MTNDDTTIFEQERPRLVGIAYRMCGDVAASEDIVQDAYLRWVSRREQDGPNTIEKPAAYLTTIVTRLAIDYLRSATKRRETYVGPWLAEPVLFDTPASDRGPDEVTILAESVTLGFLKLLDELSPLERAVYLLHDAFDLPFADIAPIVERSEVTCRKIASRARTKVRERRDPARRRASTEREQAILAAFGAAVFEADLDAIQGLLTDDVVIWGDGGGIKHAAIRPVSGPHRAARFIVGVAKKKDPASTHFEIATVNGEVGVLVFDGNELDLVWVMSITDEGIDAIHGIRNPAKLTSLDAGFTLPC